MDLNQARPIGFERNMRIQAMRQRNVETQQNFNGPCLDLNAAPARCGYPPINYMGANRYVNVRSSRPPVNRFQGPSVRNAYSQETSVQGTNEPQPFWQAAFDEWNRTHAQSGAETLAPLQLGWNFIYVTANLGESTDMLFELQFDWAAGLCLRGADISSQYTYRWNNLGGIAISKSQDSVVLFKPRSDHDLNNLRQLVVARIHNGNLHPTWKQNFKKFVQELISRPILEQSSWLFEINGIEHIFYKFLK